MDFEARKLEFGDIFTLTNILSKFGVDELRGCFKGIDIRTIGSGTDAVEKAGAVVIMNIVALLVKNLSNCRNELCAFLGDLTAHTAEDIAHLPPASAMRLLIQVMTGEEFKDFFKVALESLGMVK